MNDEKKKSTIPEKNRTIYADLQCLAMLVNKMTMGMPRRHRPTLASRMLSASIDALVCYRIAYKFMEYREEYKSKFMVEYARRHPQSLLCSINSHIGCLKKRDQYKRLQILKTLVEKKLSFILEWNKKKSCFNLKDKYTIKNFLKRKYSLDKTVWED